MSNPNACEQCDDGDGHCVFPYYGVAPHVHDTTGQGVYMRCPHCGAGEQPNNTDPRP
jgi:hypothetical protein